MNKKNKNPLITFLVTFLLIGLIFTFIGSFAFVDSIKFNQTAIETIGVITDINVRRNSDGDKIHTVYVEYDVDGKTYNETLGTYDNGMKVGKTIAIKYDPNNPQYISSNSSIVAGFIFPGIGLMFVIIPIISIINIKKKEKKEKELKSKLTPIMAKIKFVEKDRSISINHRYPDKIVCTYVNEINSKIYTFERTQIWFDATTIINIHNITELPVYVDFNKPNEYVVDIEVLEQYIGN